MARVELVEQQPGAAREELARVERRALLGRCPARQFGCAAAGNSRSSRDSTACALSASSIARTRSTSRAAGSFVRGS
jgi:hypothetical protein